jgi:hypothetical protein
MFMYSYCYVYVFLLLFLYSYCYVYVFLLLCLCIPIVMYALFCIFCFHRANWHSSATLTEVFPCLFLSCKANASVYLAKTGHVPHSSQLVICVVLCIVCVDCVVLCIVCADCVALCIVRFDCVVLCIV